MLILFPITSLTQAHATRELGMSKNVRLDKKKQRRVIHDHSYKVLDFELNSKKIICQIF